MIFDKYDELKARGKPPVKGKRQKARGKGQGAKEFAGQSVLQSFSPSAFHLISPSVFWLAKPRLRLTGRDGPPGSMELITGVPAWLGSEGKGKGRCQMPAARGTPVECGRKRRLAVQSRLLSGRLAHKSENPQCLPERKAGKNEKNSVMLCVYFVFLVVKNENTTGVAKETQGSQRVVCFNKGRPLALHGKMTVAGGKSNVGKVYKRCQVVDADRFKNRDLSAFTEPDNVGKGGNTRIINAVKSRDVDRLNADLSACAEPARLRHSGGPDNDGMIERNGK